MDATGKLVGYITHRNEDGTWYLQEYRSVEEGGFGLMFIFTPYGNDAVGDIDETLAKRLLAQMEAKGLYACRYHAYFVAE